MSTISPVRIRLLLVLLPVLAALAVATVSLGVAPPGSAAPAALRTGSGFRLPGGDFVGFYVTRAGVKVYCIDPGNRAPRTVSLSSVSRYRGMAQHTADELAYALSTWGNASTKAQAAVESQLVNTLVGHAAAVRRRAAHLPRFIAARVAAHLRTVRERRGPYTLTVRGGRVAAPGQSATGSASLTTGTGKGLPAAVLRMHGSGNVTLPATVRTGPRGTVAFRYTVTGPGPVRIDATATGLAPPRFTGTHPASGQQRMVSWSRQVGAAAHTGFEARLGALAHSYACTTTCLGHPRTTLRACAAPSAYPSRLMIHTGATTQLIDFPAATHARCRSVVVVLADQDRVSAAWTFRGPQGWTQPVPAGGGFVIDCPAVPAIEIALGYDCAAGSFAATVRAPVGHAVVLVIAGSVTRRVEAPAGAIARFTAGVRCGTVQNYTVQAGIQRGGGGWNYGPAARIGTPGAARQP